MREKIILSLAGLGTLLLLWNFNTIFLHLGDDALQGAIFRIMFIHIPAAIGAYTFYSVAVLSSIIFLVRKNFKYDSLAVACVEVGQVFTLVNLVTGSICGASGGPGTCG
jgi:heme exporter protein C